MDGLAEIVEGYSDVPYKEVRWTRTWLDPQSEEIKTSTATAIVEYGLVKISEELFDRMMIDLGFFKEVD